MNDALLIRGLKKNVRQQLQKLAMRRNLSLNQMVIQIIEHSLQNLEDDHEMERRRKNVFERVRELREELHLKYGKFDDSTKLIREDRDSH